MMSEEDLFKIDIGDEVSDEESSKRKPDYYVDHFLIGNDIDEGLIEDDGDNNSSMPGSSETCWNCSKVGHNLRECPLPHDRIKISQTKKAFQKTQSSKRYHDNKFAKFRPGKCSSKLREALGLRSNEVPYHIYKMRVLGYPPGWLDEAKITNSGIKMYNSSGKRIPEPGEEEGEIVNKCMKYDIEKIIEYPGFNVSLERYFRDESRSYGFPPIKSQHKLKNFIKHLEKISADIEKMTDNSTDDESVDMDMSEMLPVVIVEENVAIGVSNRRVYEINVEKTWNSNDSNSKSSNSTMEEGEIPLTTNTDTVYMSEDKAKDTDITLDQLEGEEHLPEQSEEVESTPDTLNRKRNLVANNDKEIQNKKRKSDELDIETKDVNSNDKEDNVEKEKTNRQVLTKTQHSKSTFKLNDTISCESITDKTTTKENSDRGNSVGEKCMDVETVSEQSESFSSPSTELTLSSNTTIKRSAPIDIENHKTSQNNHNSLLNSPVNNSSGSSSFGTPNIKSHSPFAKLPSFENFNKDISDVIDFENLPDSVGKYESMCTIISKIRSFMSSKLTKNSKGEPNENDR